MAPKSGTPAGKKKSSSSGSSESSKAVKFKLPVEYIARPLPNKENNDKNISVVIINPDVSKELDLSNGSMCIVSKIGRKGIVAVVKTGDASNHETNVIMLSACLRSVGNIILGDRLELKKAQNQPPYASTVTIGNLSKDDIKDDGLQKRLEQLLDSAGIIMPGMIFKGIENSSGKDNDCIVIDALDDSIPDIANMALEEQSTHAEDDLIYLSSPVIFRKGSSKVKLSIQNQPNPKYHLPETINYDLVGGLSKEISSLKSTIELPLHNPTLFTRFSVNPPRGILLHGPPGTGKTMLLRCVANSSNAHVLTINGPSIVSKYLGETEAALRDIFNEATRYQPSIIFIDEIDSLAPNRSSDDSGEVESRVVATLLTLMDGMGGSGRLVVVAATNRPNSIDPALRRPGRFDQEVEIGIPDIDARLDILMKQFSKMSPERHSLSEDQIKSIASKTHGYVGADLTALARESVMKTIQRGLQNNVNFDDLSLKVMVEDVESAMTEVRPSAMREIFLEMPKVYWSDIGGQEDLKRMMKEIIQLPLEAAETFQKIGVSAPKGVLLYGPPGCSKTLTAKALATESGVNFLAVKGPEIFNKYVGESERAIREIFRKARAAAPSIIFFDEIDAISADRSGDGPSTSAAGHVLTSLLNEIDGVEELHGVVIVGATNRPDEIDAALLRPGRLDRHIYVGPPDLTARLQILRKCTKKFNPDMESNFDLKDLAKRTEGCSGAEVVLLCQEAGLAAITENLVSPVVEARHFEKALSGISRGITQDMLDYYNAFAMRSGISV